MNPIDLHNAHLDAMKAASDAAKRSQAEDGRAHPKVGAVLLKGGQLLATAFRGELGSGDHAEYTLFEKKLTGVDVSDATLFTTLEPCTARKHYKSCSEWIIEKKVRHVFIGILDPNPRIYAQGFTQLKQHGIRVDFFRADLRDEIRRDNATFIAQYFANPELSGEATFNYSLNDGKYTIGHGAFMFETRWAEASDVNIHVYKDATKVRALRLALGAAPGGGEPRSRVETRLRPSEPLQLTTVLWSAALCAATVWGPERGRESFLDSSYRGRGSGRAITMGTLPGTGYLIKTGD